MAVAAGPTVEDVADLDDEDVGDDLLRLMFIACHPVLSRDTRVALTLRMLGGLRTDEIARAFLVPEPTVAQRIVRAKRTLRAAEVPFELPPRHELGDRLASVLEVIYLVFNEGYAATVGDDWVRPELCNEALRLGRVLAGAGPRRARGARPRRPDGDPGVAGRRPHDARGRPVLLLDQDRGPVEPGPDHARPDRARHGVEPRRDAGAVRPAGRHRGLPRPGPHRRRHRLGADRRAYDALAQLTPTPVIELNRAVALARAFGPASGLEVVDGLVDDPSLQAYHLLPAVRGDLLDQLGRRAEAAASSSGPRRSRATPASGRCCWAERRSVRDPTVLSSLTPNRPADGRQDGSAAREGDGHDRRGRGTRAGPATAPPPPAGASGSGGPARAG